MKEFKKLALAAAVASLPVSGFAMEAMDDAALSGVTGQDGITIALGNDIAANIIIHDTDGFTGAANSGAIMLTGFQQNLNGGDIVIDIDAGNDGTLGTALNVGITLPASMTLVLGDLQVADSNRTNGATGGSWGTTGAAVTVMELGTLSLGSTSLNLQLGHEYQGSMIAMDTIIGNGIVLNNFAINDASVGGGQIYVEELSLVDNGGTDLTVDQTIDVDADGLVINVVQLGDATNGADLRLAGVRLGDNTQASIGDIEITGLKLDGIVTIRGH